MNHGIKIHDVTEIGESVQEIGPSIDHALTERHGKRVGFVLFAFELDTSPAGMAYIGNVAVEDIARIAREFLDQYQPKENS